MSIRAASKAGRPAGPAIRRRAPMSGPTESARVASTLVCMYAPPAAADINSDIGATRGRLWIVYNNAWTYTPEGAMSKVALTRTNLLLETAKVRRLRRVLGSPSNSEAVRRTINERLATEAGLQALRELRRFGGPEDVFGRAATDSR
jgi:hypothetical protein